MTQSRVVIVTGGGSGFGRAAALQLAGSGARLAIGDLNAASADDTAKLARERGAEAWAHALDVTDERSVGDLTSGTLRKFGRIDGAFNSAGVLGPVETPLAGPLFALEGMRETMLARQSLEHFGAPEEVAALVVWLLSPAASLVTGTPLRVDAGALA